MLRFLKTPSRQVVLTANRRAVQSIANYSTAVLEQETSKPVSVKVKQQAPNRVETWAASQRPRSDVFKGPRFEQVNLEEQPAPYAAIDLIAKQPIRYVHGQSAVCDGGNGAQGHPKIFINVEAPGSHACLYCGLRYAEEKYKASLEKKE